MLLLLLLFVFIAASFAISLVEIQSNFLVNLENVFPLLYMNIRYLQNLLSLYNSWTHNVQFSTQHYS